MLSGFLSLTSRLRQQRHWVPLPLAHISHLIPCAIQQQSSTFSLLFLLLLMPHKSSACYIWCPLTDWGSDGLCFSWPHLCMLWTVSLLFLGHLSVPAPLIHFHDIFLLVCSFMQASHHISSPLSQDRSFFREGVGRENQSAVLATSALWDCILWDTFM